MRFCPTLGVVAGLRPGLPSQGPPHPRPPRTLLLIDLKLLGAPSGRADPASEMEHSLGPPEWLGGAFGGLGVPY